VDSLFTVFMGALAILLTLVSSTALVIGSADARLAMTKKQALAAEELGLSSGGWMSVAGCIRHDLAVGVGPAGRVYPIGSAANDEETDRTFTPLCAVSECDEEKKPTRIYALIEEQITDDNTLHRVYDVRVAVAPPPVRAMVDGVMGYFYGHPHQAQAARDHFIAAGLGGTHVDDAPLLAKGRRPGVFWVGALTAASGLHGFLLLALGFRWMVRRHRRLAEARRLAD